MLKELDTYDWEEAFGFGNPQHANPTNTTRLVSLDSFSNGDVKTLYGIYEGCNDEDSWECYGKLNDGRYFCLEAWCDYTGWDCQSGGKSFVAGSKEEIEQFGLTEASRMLFKVVLN